jgi:hypothetical protein
MTASRDPSEEEVHQIEPELYEPVEVPVRVEGPADVRVLPAVAWFPTRFEVTGTTGPVKLVSRNPYRKRLLLHSETAGFFYGSSQAQVAGRGACPFIAENTPIELIHTEEVWANCLAGESPVVSVTEEMWTN